MDCFQQILLPERRLNKLSGAWDKTQTAQVPGSLMRFSEDSLNGG